ncbi:hypothetical protein HYV79_02445 [Candidatus Woesearchaeota archaeon]|nr:hypothetical protein [Candidatus Woesearchaeota archaeon]
MHEVTTFEFILNWLVIALYILIISLVLKMMYKSKEVIPKIFLMISLGFLPKIFFHIFESLAYFNLNLLPSHETLQYALFRHSTDFIALLSVFLYFNWFDKKFITPIYSFCENLLKQKKSNNRKRNK